MTSRLALASACVLGALLALAGCSSNPATSNADSQTTTVTASTATTDAAPPASDTPTGSSSTGFTAAQQAFAGTMTAAGFFPGGTQDYVIDAAGDAVCGSLRTESMSKEIAYEEQVDENADTGMTTNKDILLFVTDAVKAFCPQYASELPAS